MCSPFPQLDTEYRKKWDALVIKLEVVDRDPNTGSEIVHWATHFPVSFYTAGLRQKSSLCSICTKDTFLFVVYGDTGVALLN